jgi:hypothetical protein
VPPAIVRARERTRHQRLLRNGDAEFLLQFANKRGFRLLAGLHLAAGKFPKTRHCAAGSTALKKDLSVAPDQGRRNDDEAIRLIQRPTPKLSLTPVA